jgi:phosphatidate cytidylyltransferase
MAETSKKQKHSNLKLRLIAGVIGAVLIIASIVLGEWTYFAIFLLISQLTLLEFYKLAGMEGMSPLKLWGALTGMLIFTLSFFVQKGMIPPGYYLAIFPFMSITFFIKLYKKNEKKPFYGIAFNFLGIVYVTVPFTLLNFTVYFQDSYHYDILMGLLLLLWAADTGAYFAGTRFGKRKLFYRISPKKSWEGFLGGSVLALLVSIALAFFATTLLWWQWNILAFIIIVAGTYGDLVESLLKRSLAIKDSSAAIPGHGGFLDRFDGLLLSTPFIVAFLEIVRF